MKTWNYDGNGLNFFSAMTRSVSEREVLRGKRIAFVTAGYPGKRFIYDKAKHLGIEITIIDSPQSWSRDLIAEGVIRNFISIDFGLPHELVVADILDAMRVQGVQVDGVCTFAEMSLPIASKLAECLGVPGSPPEVVGMARDKHMLRKLASNSSCFHEVRSYRIICEADLLAGADYVGFPAVLKPVSGADSLGVKKVENLLELQESFAEMSALLARLVVSSGALCRVETGKEQGELASRYIRLDLLLEEYLDGPEVDVDLVLYKKKCYFAAVVDNGPTKEPFFAETWNLSPSLLPFEKQNELIHEAIETVLAVGFTDGVFHVEEKYTNKGARIVEINARMGGGPVRLMHKCLYGVDLVVEQLLSCLGLPPSIPENVLVPAKSRKEGVCVASCTPNAPRSGTLRSADFFDKVKSLENLLGAWPFVNAGSPVVGLNQGQPSWLCEIALTGKNGSAALLEELTRITDDLVADVDANYYL